MSKSGPENAEYNCHLYFSVKSEITRSKSQFLIYRLLFINLIFLDLLSAIFGMLDEIQILISRLSVLVK